MTAPIDKLPAIGVIGVGQMGGAMVGRLRDLGHPVVVRDTDPLAEAAAVALGASAASTPSALAAVCDVVIVVVVDGAQTEAVLFGPDGAAAAMGPGRTVVLCPTISPADIERHAGRLDAAGIDWLDAPMSGGPLRTRNGTMSLMLACREPVRARLRPLLDGLANHVFYVGERAGDGARTKLVNNLLATIALAGTAEVLALAERIGLDPGRTLDVIDHSSGQNWIGSERMRRLLAGDTLARARTALLTKDSHLALDEARAAGVDLPVGAEAAALFARACAEGFVDEDDASLLTLLRRR